MRKEYFIFNLDARSTIRNAITKINWNSNT